MSNTALCYKGVVLRAYLIQIWCRAPPFLDAGLLCLQLSPRYHGLLHAFTGRRPQMVFDTLALCPYACMKGKLVLVIGGWFGSCPAATVSWSRRLCPRVRVATFRYLFYGNTHAVSIFAWPTWQVAGCLAIFKDMPSFHPPPPTLPQRGALFWV